MSLGIRGTEDSYSDSIYDNAKARDYSYVSRYMSRFASFTKKVFVNPSNC
jgi:hypothetical protein